MRYTVYIRISDLNQTQPTQHTQAAHLQYLKVIEPLAPNVPQCIVRSRVVAQAYISKMINIIVALTHSRLEVALPGIRTRGSVATPIQNRFIRFSCSTQGSTSTAIVYTVVAQISSATKG